MTTHMMRWYLVLVSVLLLAAPVLAQEEAAEASNLGPGLMIFVLGAGALVVLVLGAAVSAQQQDEAEAAEKQQA